MGQEVVAFARQLVESLAALEGEAGECYELASQHAHSCSVLLASTKYRIGGQVILLASTKYRIGDKVFRSRLFSYPRGLD